MITLVDSSVGRKWVQVSCRGGYALVTLPRTVTPYRESVDETRARVMYQKLVTR